MGQKRVRREQEYGRLLPDAVSALLLSSPLLGICLCRLGPERPLLIDEESVTRDALVVILFIPPAALARSSCVFLALSSSCGQELSPRPTIIQGTGRPLPAASPRQESSRGHRYPYLTYHPSPIGQSNGQARRPTSPL